MAGSGSACPCANDDGGEWRPVSAPDNPLVRGSTFDLYPAERERIDDLMIALKRHAADHPQSGSSSDEFDYTYAATVTADPRKLVPLRCADRFAAADPAVP